MNQASIPEVNKASIAARKGQANKYRCRHVSTAGRPDNSSLLRDLLTTRMRLRLKRFGHITNMNLRMRIVVI